MIHYQVETLHECLHDLVPLLIQHHAELSRSVAFDPDWDNYFNLEAMDMLVVTTVRDGEMLIGYSVTVITPSFHTSGLVYGINDALYVVPEYRKGHIARKLLEYVHDRLKSCGVTYSVVNMKTEKPFRPLLARLGYELTEERWEVELDG